MFWYSDTSVNLLWYLDQHLNTGHLNSGQVKFCYSGVVIQIPTVLQCSPRQLVSDQGFGIQVFFQAQGFVTHSGYLNTGRPKLDSSENPAI